MIYLKTKRGQAAAGAAVLIAIIAFFIIMFIILIPPQERAELLGETESSTSTTDEEPAASEKSLLAVNPGRVDYLAQKDIEHPLPVINLRTKTESSVVAERNVADIKRGVFSEQIVELPFSLLDPSNTKNALLSFEVKDIEGRLIITLNGQDVYNGLPSLGQIEPIHLPESSLQLMNMLKFTVSSSGMAFWKTNGALLEKIKVVADITDLGGRSSKNVFLVSETEMKNLEKVKLSFKPECTQGEIGRLVIAINGNEIYNAIPDCDLSLVPIEVSTEFIKQGQNEILFHTDEGTCLLSHVIVESELKGVDFPTYYFDLSYEEQQEVEKDRLEVLLTMSFVDVVDAKKGDLVVNGHVRSFETKETSYSMDLSTDIVKGTNSLKIKPKKTLEIRELKVDLVK